MSKAFFTFILFLSCVYFSFAGSERILYQNRDSVLNYPNYLRGWVFSDGDDSTMALASYDDSKWEKSKSSVFESVKTKLPLNGIGWYRLHVVVDSTISKVPLAMTVTHLGASETYLDGKLIQSFGKINGTDSSEYYDPQERPFIFMFEDTGAHTIAVRYANFDTERNDRVYKSSFSGFKMMIGETELYIRMKDQRSTILTFTMMLLGGIFYALCLIHLFMFLYYRTAKSNLYFSVLMFSLATLFVIGLISYASHSPTLELIAYLMIGPFFTIACLALSGFINELFSKGRLRFRILLSCGIVILILSFFESTFSTFLIVALSISVSFEAVVSIIFEIVRKTKGARIIGTGILFFALFILTTYTFAIISNGAEVDINDSTVGGRIYILSLGLAILSIPFSMSVYLAWSFSSMNRSLEIQLQQVKSLSQKTIEQEHEKQMLLENRKEELEKEVLVRTSELREEKKKSDDLLLNILPAEVAEELKEKGRTSAKTYSLVTVMFTDFKDFTDVSEKISAELLVAEIDYCFSGFDRIIQNYKIEKIKTIGDAYICAAGLPVLNFTHAEDMVNAALEIRTFMLNRKNEKEAKGEIPFELRIGINTGPLVAGIVGVKKFAYDIWGDTVNLAARMESSGEAGKVNISGATYQLVKGKFKFEHRGKIEAKNKGEVEMYFVELKD